VKRIAIVALSLATVFAAASCGGGGGGPIIPGNQLPNAAFVADATTGDAPLTVNFDASGSTDPDGAIAKFEWDLDGNGSFETNTGTTATTSRQYTVDGNVTVRLQVTDNSGDTDTATIAITVTTPGGGLPNLVVPPAEAFTDRSGAGDDAVTKWLKNVYHPLPMPFDADRVFQNASLRAWADEVLRLTNIERVNAGLNPVLQDDHLEMMEQAHCRDMALRDYFDHFNPEGLSPHDRLDAMQPPPLWATGENIAAGQDTPQEVVTGWMNSPGHRANILTPGYTHMGIGFFYDSAAGDQFVTYWGQAFATIQDDPNAHDWLDPTEAP
jgi:uncharacterized protein YkwD